VEVSYTTTLDDYVAFSLHTFKRSPSMKRRFVAAWVLVPLAFLLLAAMVWGSDRFVAFSLAAGGVGAAILHPFLYRKNLERAVRAYAQDLGARGVIGRITLVLTDESLTERTETTQSVARWQDMKGVEVVGDCTYIWVTGITAAIIPRHCFEREEDYEAVREFAVAKLGKPG
jgi:hypothetical protein